jgi:hypothetical protein
MKIELTQEEINFIQSYCELSKGDYDDSPNKKKVCIELAKKLERYIIAKE